MKCNHISVAKLVTDFTRMIWIEFMLGNLRHFVGNVLWARWGGGGGGKGGECIILKKKIEK